MEFAPIPSFLSNGSFRRDGLGYRFSEPPPLDLLSPGALNHPDNWIRLASVLEHAKVGDFRYLGELKSLVNPTADPFLVSACFQLWGDVGNADGVNILVDFMTNHIEFLAMQACQAALHSGYLWLVPHILECWNRVGREDDRETVGLILSEMLEDDLGPISSPQDFSENDYRQLVKARASELSSKYGTDAVPIWAGSVFSVIGVAREMLRILTTARKEGFPLYADFLDKRERFEASTGTDCSSFYSGGGVQAFAAKAVLTGFLNSEESKRYKDGIRYFFGHEVPLPQPIKKAKPYLG